MQTNYVPHSLSSSIPTIASNASLPPIFVYNALGGRLDHTLHSLNQLHRCKSRQVFLVSAEEGLTFLLAPGENWITLPHEAFGPACGIVPIGQPSVITTSGLVWDVSEWETKFGGEISTSNLLKDEMVKVWTDKPVLFTVEVKAEAFGSG